MDATAAVRPIPDLASFDAIWDELAEQGRTDTRGGAEYQRVRAAWEAGAVTNAVEIVRCANMNADGVWAP